MLRIWKPALFQGGMRRSGYFEGWYFKHVSLDEKGISCVIPGVSLPRDKARSHAFIQVYDVRSGVPGYARYPLSDFQADRAAFLIRIAQSSFSLDGMRLRIDSDGLQVKADLRYGNIRPWPVSLLSPGAMGWYAFVPGMECYHAVLSFNHSIEGYIEHDGIRKDYTGGKGYMEKNWGPSMPGSWIWMQTNHFDEPEAPFFGSIAKVPWLRRYFTGYLFGLYLKDRIHRFTTYTGARVCRLSIGSNRFSCMVEDSHYLLEIEGTRAPGARLMAPRRGEMLTGIHESLTAEIRVVFICKETRKVIFSGTGRNAGLEYVGDVQELIEGFET